MQTGTASDLLETFAYNPASQITSVVRSNTAYSFTGYATGSTPTTTNGLNEMTAVNGVTYTNDANGNLSSDGANAYSQDIENHLTAITATGVSAVVAYDPLGRLAQLKGSTVADRTFLQDPVTGAGGDNVVAEYNSLGVMQHRYVPIDGLGAPIVDYNSAGTRSWLMADERGSVIASANDSGAITAINAYDEYGIPKATNTGRFQYAGQMWLSEVSLYSMRNRMYGAQWGRFLQPDPLRYGGDGPNLYAYVLNDPVNATDPLGLGVGEPSPGDIVVIACPNGGYLSFDGFHCNDPADIVVTHARLPGIIPQSLTQPGNPNGDLQDGGAPFYFDGTKFVPDKIYNSQCASNALQGNALSVGLDLAGLIPGESTLAGLTKLSAGIFGSAYAGASGDNPGAILGAVGVGTETAQMAGDVGSLVPFVGSLVSSISLTRDIVKVGQQISNCPGGH